MLISYQDWMTRTKKGLLTTRSRELGTLDTAIEQFHQTRSVSNLINLRTHLAAWQKTKTDWKTSTRNTDSAGKHPVQELVKAVGTNAPPAVAAGKSTLTDQGHVANFASAAKHNVHQAWTVWSADERARVLYEAVSDIFRACGVPEPKLSLVADLGGDAGQFQFSSWTLAVASSYFQDNNVPNRHDFLEGA